MPFVGAAVVARASLGSLQLVGATQNSQTQGKKVPSFTKKMTGRSEQERAFFVGDEHGNVVHPKGKRRPPNRGPVSQPLYEKIFRSMAAPPSIQ
nr:hypothetical protein CFP56_25138 [Quercus suber]